MRTLARSIVAIMALVVMTAWPCWSQRAPVLSPDTLTTIRVYAAWANKLASSPTRTPQDSMAAIGWMTEAVKMANPQFSEPYTNMPNGEFVWVPKTGVGLVPYVTEPWNTQSEKGCIWQISAYHLYGVRPVAPDPAPAIVPVPAQQEPSQSWGDKIGDWAFPLWGLIALAGLTAVVAGQRRKRQLDPATHPPVVPRGLSDDPQTTLRQVQAATTVRHGLNRNVVSVERGKLRASNDRKSFIVPMEFGDGVTRNKRLNAGDQCWRVRVQTEQQAEPSTEYWYHHCGNRFGEVKSGQFELPAGWEFDPSGVSAQTPQPSAVPVEAAPEVAQAAQSIEQVAARVVADRKVQAEINPDGVHTIELVVENGTPTPTKATITSKGHRPIKTADYRVKDGVFKITT